MDLDLVVDPPVTAAIHGAMRTAHGAEPCGYLLGRDTPTGARIRSTVAGRNVHPHPHRAFLLAPEEQLAARQGARALGLELMGFWHGHPHGPPRPSQSDLAGLGALAPAWMLIAGRDGAGGRVEIRGYRVRKGRAQAARLTSSAPPRPLPR